MVLKIYNMLGGEVITLVDAYKTSGNHSVVWNGKDQYGKTVSSGVYMYRLEVENNTVISGQSKKLILLK